MTSSIIEVDIYIYFLTCASVDKVCFCILNFECILKVEFTF
jgi:hypothetical protein